MATTNIEILQDFFTLVPPKFRLVSFISMTIKPQAFIAYTNNMNLMTIQQSNIDEADRMFVYLPLALMYENQDMMNFIYQIMNESGYKISQNDFNIEVKKYNTHLLTAYNTQLGGGKITEYLYAVGIIIFAIFYDYYIITNGSWDRLESSISQIKELSVRVREGCEMEYKPSKTISLLARGTKDASFIYNLEHVMQCLSTPTLVSAKLHKLDVEKESTELLFEMQKKITGLPGFPELPKPTEIGTQLVPFGNDPQEIEDYLTSRLLVSVTSTDTNNNDKINVDETINQFKLLADMSTDEFKKVFEIKIEQPTKTPIQAPTQAPIFQQTSSFVSDLVGAVSELAPTKFSPSFSFQNVFLWALQDTIRDTIRKIEDGKIKSKRDIENLLTNTSRIFSDISSLPYIISLLFFLNLAAMRSLVFFAKKILGSKSKLLAIENGTESNNRFTEIEDDTDEITGKLNRLTLKNGGYLRRLKRRTIYKQKCKTYKRKYGKKKRQTKRKKNRRITRRR